MHGQCGARYTAGGGGVYPGWGMGLGGSVGGLYRYPGPASNIPIFSHILASKPTYGQMKAILMVLDEVS